MADSPILLSSLLADTRSAVDEVVHAKAAERPDAALVGKALTRLGDAVDTGVRAACNKDLVGLLVEGWGKAMELRSYGDPVKYPPPHTTRMFVGKHPMKVSVDPELTLSIGTLKFPLRFIVEFVAAVNAVRLTIRDGAIADVDIGTLEVGAKLRWGTTEVPLPLMTREIQLPGHFGIAPPFVIPH